MTVERIREAVLSEAREEAEEIVREAQELHDSRLESKKKEIDRELEGRYEQKGRRAEQEQERRVMNRRSEHNLKLLQMRNSILDDLFKRAGQRVAELPDDQYRELLAEWMDEIPGGTEGKVLCREKDADRVRPLIDELNQERETDAQLELVPGDDPELGGVIFQTEKLEVDLSVKSRVNSLQEELAPEIAAEIFPEDISV
ncbi:MAG: V-type ATP synthase subunit E [Candidatus Brocadiia bacterium]